MSIHGTLTLNFRVITTKTVAIAEKTAIATKHKEDTNNYSFRAKANLGKTDPAIRRYSA